MIIVQVKEGELIDRPLKRFKRKFDRTGTMREIRRRTAYMKPSVRRRKCKIKRRNRHQNPLLACTIPLSQRCQ